MDLNATARPKIKPRQRVTNHLLAINDVPWEYVSPLRRVYRDFSEFSGKLPAERVLMLAEKYKIHVVDEFRELLRARVATAPPECEDDRFYYRSPEALLEQRVRHVFASLRMPDVTFGVIEEPLYPGATEKQSVRVLQRKGFVIGEIAQEQRDENDGTHYGLLLLEKEMYYAHSGKEHAEQGQRVSDSTLSTTLKKVWILPKPYDFKKLLE